MRRALLVALFFLPALAAAQEVEFTLKATPLVGNQDEVFTVVVQQVVHGVDAPDRYYPPELRDFTIVDQQSQQSTQWVLDPRHGQQIMNVVTRWYRLKAQRTGKLRVGEAKILFGGQEKTTKPVVIEVLPPGKQAPTGVDPNAPGAAAQPQGNSNANVAPGFTPPDLANPAPTFIHAVADRTKVFAGEQVTVSWLLYTRSDVLKFEPKPPRLDGFWAETLFEPQNYFTYHEESVGGRDYSVAVIAKRALFPTKAGKVTIPRYEAEVSTLYTSFAAPLHLASPEITIDVEPLPAGAPPGFDPAYVGNFSLEASVDRDAVAAGESLTLALKVSGAGAIRRAAVPPLVLDGFDVTPRKDFGQRVDTSGDILRGERRYTYLLTPLRAGKVAIPSITIPFFDPGAAKYDLAKTDPIPVMVIGDPAALRKGPSGQSAGENVIGREIRPLREDPAISSRMVARFYHSRLFLGALALPMVAWLLVVLVDWLRERLRRETPRARLRRARGRARRRLRVAELHIRGNRAGKFFGELARVLQEHIEERVGEPVAALTREKLRELLQTRGFPDDTVDALVHELENCDFARFAPSASGPGEMRSALRRVRALLGAIERVRPSRAVEAAA
jgi:hypothetical protein